MSVGFRDDVGDCLGGQRTVLPVSLLGGAQEPEDSLSQLVLALRGQRRGMGVARATLVPFNMRPSQP